jgi:hypothetical protein
VTGLTVEIAGVCGGPTTETLAVDGLLVIVLFLSVHERASVPTAPAVKVIELSPPLKTPEAPPGLVIVPPETDQL